MKIKKHLPILCTTCMVLLLTACGPSTPEEKVIESFNDAIERVDNATSQKSLNAASQILIADIKDALKGLDPVTQNKIMTSSPITKVEVEYNQKVFAKRKVVK